MAKLETSAATNTRKLYFISLEPSNLNGYYPLPIADSSSITLEEGTGDEGSTYVYSGSFDSTSDGIEYTEFSGTVTGVNYRSWSHDYSVMPEIYYESGFTLSGFSLDVSIFQSGKSSTEIATLIFRGDDEIFGSGAADDLFGFSGHDRLTGGRGNDLYTVNGGDKVVEARNEGTDTIKSTVNCTLSANVEKLVLLGTAPLFGTGNELPNTITGNGGGNVLKGLEGNDVLVGGLGRDTLYGGKGTDVFDFNSLAEIGKTSTTRDIIADFTHLQDDINLWSIDANAKLAGNQAFKFIGTQAFHKVAAELHYVRGSTTVISGDVNGDGKVDFQLALTGSKTLTAGDFIL